MKLKEDGKFEIPHYQTKLRIVKKSDGKFYIQCNRIHWTPEAFDVEEVWYDYRPYDLLAGTFLSNIFETYDEAVLAIENEMEQEIQIRRNSIKQIYEEFEI